MPTRQRESRRRQPSVPKRQSYRNNNSAVSSRASQKSNAEAAVQRGEAYLRYRSRQSDLSGNIQTGYRTQSPANYQSTRSSLYSSMNMQTGYRAQSPANYQSTRSGLYSNTNMQTGYRAPSPANYQSTRSGLYSNTYTGYTEPAARPQADTAGAAEAAGIRTVRRLTPAERALNKRKVKARMAFIAGVVVVFLMCVVMLYRQTAIFGKNQEIEALTDEYNNILVTNEEIQANIDRSIELGNLESVAKNELGMVSPDSSQIFYVDMGARDEVVKDSSSK